MQGPDQTGQRMHYGLDGKVILVMGGGYGLGRQAARAAGASGARVAVVDFDAGRAQQTADLIKEAGGEAISHSFDASTPAANEAAVAQAVSHWGHLDGAFNAGGRGGPLYAKLQDLDAAAWRETLEAQVSGLWFAMRAQAAQMRSQQGGSSIVNAAGSFNSETNGMRHALNASKHAIVGLTQSVASEYSSAGIRVNAVCPGWTDEPISRTQGAMVSVLTQQNAGAAGLVAWLLSDAAAFMTGAALPVPEDETTD